MHSENRLVEFIRGAQISDLPKQARDVVTTMVSTVIGTTIAGSSEDGCGELRQLLLERGGRPESTVLVYGDRLPAASAAQLNGTMARALDYCDAMAPGLHLGSCLVPAALAAIELRGQVSGDEFLTAIAVGAEVGSRLNLTEGLYDGFDPTGVVGPMAATATVARILKLSAHQTKDALGLAFNRTGASFQSNVDGSLAVRLIQGWVAESAVTCAQWAEAGMTGPSGFLGGVYGYVHLFGRDQITSADITEGLGGRWKLADMMFKKYPSCGLTQGVTELALLAYADGVRAKDVGRIEVSLPPYAYRLVGTAFEPGESPRVDAQFSAQYCVANALLRGSSRLEHFVPAAVTDAEVRALADRISIRAEPTMDERGHTAVDLKITTSSASADYVYSLDTAPGFPGNALTAAEHHQRLRDCFDAAPHPLPPLQEEELMVSLQHLEQLQDVRSLIRQLVVT